MLPKEARQARANREPNQRTSAGSAGPRTTGPGTAPTARAQLAPESLKEARQAKEERVEKVERKAKAKAKGRQGKALE